MRASATERRPRRPRRLGIVLLASFGLTVASFMVASWVADDRARGILGDAHEIVNDSIPAMNHLADARTALRDVAGTIDDLLDVGRQTEASDAALRRGRDRLKAEWATYKTLPPFPNEQAQWPAVERDLATLDETIDHLVADVRRHHNGEARIVHAGQVDPVIERVDARLRGLTKLNAESAIAMAENVRTLRLESRRWILALDAVAAVFAAIAAFAALRLVARYSRLMEHRVDQLEQFSGRVAHDIRSPLSAVGLALELLDRRSAPDEKTQATLARARRALGRVGQLVDGLLLFARSGATPQEPASASLKEVIDGVIEDQSALAKDQGIELRVESVGSRQLACSTGVLGSLISNLVANAIKYMGAAPIRRVVVRVRGARGHVRVEVEDTGPGIPRGRQETVFDPYIRGPGSSVPGLGLGLATVRRLAEAHGGSVGVESCEGRGSVFWFELPEAPARHGPHGTTPAR